jgi:hypothetical protein
MIHNVSHNAAVAAAVAARPSMAGRATSSGQVTIPEEQSDQYDFAAIFGAASDERTTAPAAPDSGAASGASATASPVSTVAAPSAVAAAASTTPASTAATAASVASPGIGALVGAIMNGSFQGGNVANPSQLTETTPWGTDTLSNFYYASDQTANQLAQLLGGKVVQMPAFGQATGFTEPLANFIELPDGQTVNAAALAYYSQCGAEGSAQLTADLTQTINEGSAMTNFYQNGGPMPSFAQGYTGPAIAGMTYPAGAVGADGTVVNPATQPSMTQGA